jgi:hypothetical protein
LKNLNAEGTFLGIFKLLWSELCQKCRQQWNSSRILNEFQIHLLSLVRFLQEFQFQLQLSPFPLNHLDSRLYLNHDESCKINLKKIRAFYPPEKQKQIQFYEKLPPYISIYVNLALIVVFHSNAKFYQIQVFNLKIMV